MNCRGHVHVAHCRGPIYRAHRPDPIHIAHEIQKTPMWAGETATSYFPIGLPLQYHRS